MSGTETPFLDIEGVTKHYGSPDLLRVRRLIVAARDRLALSGLGPGAAEALLHLITGASVPDQGVLRVEGRDTRHIATDTEWLASLDRFGIVTERAVLIGTLPIADNMALPLTLSIDPMSDETRQVVESLADLVGLPRERLRAAASALTAEERVRVHLARALAPNPTFLLLEHPTATIQNSAASRSLGRTLRDAAGARGAGWLALTGDREFARASGSRRLVLRATSGEVAPDGLWARWWSGG
jgi:ABC-type lipoprotein export system ATPase subunit